jgi:purine-binding chemotaxis protein CheW
MAEDIPICLFRSGSLPLAVAVEEVAEIVEIEALVRISCCPPRIAGLCLYHRQVVPAVVFGSGHGLAGAAAPQKRNASTGPGDAVLIMQTDQGLWGIKIDREGTVITTERPARHEPKQEQSGGVSVGLIQHGKIDYALLDAEATWRNLREAVLVWYGQLGTSGSLSRFPESLARSYLEPAGAAVSATCTDTIPGPVRGFP